MRRSPYVRTVGVDQVEPFRPARPSRLVLPAVLTAALCATLWFSSGAVALAVLMVGVVALPLASVKSVRAALSRRHVLARSSGRLLLDGEPLDAARVELRVVKHWLLRRPQRFML